MTTITDHDVERYADVDLYGVLHLTPEASAELIDKAYRLRKREVHPDLAGAHAHRPGRAGQHRLGFLEASCRHLMAIDL